MLYTPAFFALFLANLCVVASFACYFLFPLFITSYGGNATDIGLLMGVFALASAGCRPWISPMIDRVGRKRCYTLGCLLMVCLPLLYLPFAYEPLPLVSLGLLRIVHGIGLALCFTTVFTFVADLIPPSRLNEGIGLFGISGLLGIAVGPMIGEWALSKWSFLGLFSASMLLALVSFIAHLPLNERHEPNPGRSEFFTLLRQPRYSLVAILALIFGFGLSASSNFIAPLCEERQLVAVSPFFVSYSLAAVATRLFVGRLADRVGEHRVLPWGFLICALGLLLVLPAFNSPVLAVSGFVCGIGHGLLFPTLNTLAIRNVASHSRGSVTGIFTGSIDAGIFLGSVSLGALSRLTDIPYLFLIAALVFASGWVVLYRNTRAGQ